MELIDKIIELESNPLLSGSDSSTGHSSSMFQGGPFFLCAPVGGGWKPARRVGGVRKTTAPIQKKAGVRKTTKGAAKRVKLESLPPPKTSTGDTTKPVTRKRPSTRDTSQIPDAKKPRRVATRSSKRIQSKPQGGKSVTKPITKETAKAVAGPKKPKSTTKTRQPKGNTRAKTQKLKSVATRRSTRRTK